MLRLLPLIAIFICCSAMAQNAYDNFEFLDHRIISGEVPVLESFDDGLLYFPNSCTDFLITMVNSEMEVDTLFFVDPAMEGQYGAIRPKLLERGENSFKLMITDFFACDIVWSTALVLNYDEGGVSMDTLSVFPGSSSGHVEDVAIDQDGVLWMLIGESIVSIMDGVFSSPIEVNDGLTGIDFDDTGQMYLTASSFFESEVYTWDGTQANLLSSFPANIRKLDFYENYIYVSLANDEVHLYSTETESVIQEWTVNGPRSHILIDETGFYQAYRADAEFVIEYYSVGAEMPEVLYSVFEPLNYTPNSLINTGENSFLVAGVLNSMTSTEHPLLRNINVDGPNDYDRVNLAIENFYYEVVVPADYSTTDGTYELHWDLLNEGDHAISLKNTFIRIDNSSAFACTKRLTDYETLDPGDYIHKTEIQDGCGLVFNPEIVLPGGDFKLNGLLAAATASGIHISDESSDFSLLGNPVSGSSLIVDLSGLSKRESELEMYIHDVKGILVSTHTTESSDRVEVPVAPLAEGIYFLSVIANGAKIATKKFVYRP